LHDHSDSEPPRVNAKTVQMWNKQRVFVYSNTCIYFEYCKKCAKITL